MGQDRALQGEGFYCGVAGVKVPTLPPPTGSIGERNVEGVEGHRNQAIEPDEVGKLRRAVLAEFLHRRPIRQFGQNAAIDQRGGKIIGHRFRPRQVVEGVKAMSRLAAAATNV
jgi:hypothetical protein